jgi:biotin carboxylase
MVPDGIRGGRKTEFRRENQHAGRPVPSGMNRLLATLHRASPALFAVAAIALPIILAACNNGGGGPAY